MARSSGVTNLNPTLNAAGIPKLESVIDAYKVINYYDNKHEVFTIGLMYVFAFLYMMTGYFLLWSPFLFATIWLFLLQNFKHLGQANHKFYTNWWYAPLFWKIKFNTEHYAITDKAEILAFCDRNFKNKWYFNQDQLYLRNRKQLISLKLAFPLIVDYELTKAGFK